MNYFCRTGYLVQNHQLFSCAKYLLESSMRCLLAEENKEIPNENLLLRMRQDVRDNMKAVAELAAGPPIISQIDSRLRELQNAVEGKRLQML
jgi:hypothetical protein